jgi:hypothetical protein
MPGGQVYGRARPAEDTGREAREETGLEGMKLSGDTCRQVPGFRVAAAARMIDLSAATRCRPSTGTLVRCDPCFHRVMRRGLWRPRMAEWGESRGGFRWDRIESCRGTGWTMPVSPAGNRAVLCTKNEEKGVEATDLTHPQGGPFPMIKVGRSDLSKPAKPLPCGG